jgi:acetolactate synthase-1/2/3 large subunit
MYIAHCLKQEGVEKVFGQCGHTNYALIDSCQRLGIEYVSFRHEQQAVHAADAYFRVSHRLAVVNVHLSPGMTNALTGVVTAAADSTPMVVITGNTPSATTRGAAPGHPLSRRCFGGHLSAVL